LLLLIFNLLEYVITRADLFVVVYSQIIISDSGFYELDAVYYGKGVSPFKKQHVSLSVRIHRHVQMDILIYRHT
jgi:hypothetical protein